MAVKIRLARRGKKKYAMYDVVIADSRAPRDGKFIEKIGTYNPNTNPATIKLDEEKALKWVMNGAIPTDTVRAMLSYRGILMKKHLQVGVLKGAITQEQADAKFAAWLEQKNAKIQGKVDRLAKEKAEAQKARLEAEAKIKEERAKAIAEKQKVQETGENSNENSAPEATENAPN
ncbi:30S ribosomal protein S16 [Raineya sp.]|jgi:small subunit ribosomal protein S16